MTFIPFDFSLWISPVSGRLVSSGIFPDIPEFYIWEGVAGDRPEATPVLLDMRIDQIQDRLHIENLSRKVNNMQGNKKQIEVIKGSKDIEISLTKNVNLRGSLSVGKKESTPDPEQMTPGSIRYKEDGL